MRVSDDEGDTWPFSRLVHEGPAAYSTPADLSGGCLGLLYECGELHPYERIRFARFSWDWPREKPA